MIAEVFRVGIDGTPDDEYPILILQAYLTANSQGYYSDNTAGGRLTNLMIVALNELKDRRQVILRRAIKTLRQGKARIR